MRLRRFVEEDGPRVRLRLGNLGADATRTERFEPLDVLLGGEVLARSIPVAD